MTRRSYPHDVQGQVLGIPYDFRLPSLAKVASRVANPRARMFVPKVWGMGWTLNFAHPGTWVLTSGLLVVGVVAALVC